MGAAPDKLAKKLTGGRRQGIRLAALVGVLSVFAALTLLTLVLLLDEFTHGPGQAGPSAVRDETTALSEAANETAQRATGADAAPTAPVSAGAPDASTAEGEQNATISVSPPWKRAAREQPLTRIGVGSCLHQDHPQPIWESVIVANPDLFLMLGDNVYGDIRNGDPEELAATYRTQAEQPELKAAREAFPFLAIWDDHDYGLNDGGAGFEFQPQAAEYFRQFWQLPEAQQPDGGIYYAKTIGPEGRRVQLILLDTRTFRSELKPKTDSFEHWGRYEPTDDPDQSMLGQTQWDWLEARLQEPAEIRLISSSVQILAEGHGFERWGNMPTELERLRNLLRETGTRGVIFLSGDRHSSAIYRTERDPDAAQPNLFELTASSLNRPYGPSRDARVPPLVGDIYSPENFGLVDIDWDNRTIVLSVHGIDGRQASALQVPFQELGL